LLKCINCEILDNLNEKNQVPTDIIIDNTNLIINQSEISRIDINDEQSNLSVNSNYSYIEIKDTEYIMAGNFIILNIYPKDMHDKGINITKNELLNFNISYQLNNKTNYNLLKDKEIICEFLNIYIQCKINITKSGNISFSAKYENNDIKIINKEFKIYPNKICFNNTRIFLKSENKELDRKGYNYLSSNSVLIIYLYFYDAFLNNIINQIEIDNYLISSYISNPEFKLCSYSQELSKMITFCNIEKDKLTWIHLEIKSKLIIQANEQSNLIIINFTVIKEKKKDLDNESYENKENEKTKEEEVSAIGKEMENVKSSEILEKEEDNKIEEEEKKKEKENTLNGENEEENMLIKEEEKGIENSKEDKVKIIEEEEEKKIEEFEKNYSELKREQNQIKKISV